MQQISILYNPLINDEQKQLAATLSSVLKKNNYGTELLPIRTEAETEQFLLSTNPETCQLILSINMAGYNLLNTDTTPALNHLMTNIVNYINLSPDIFSYLFNMRMNFTMSFLFDSVENAEYVKNHHPHIRNVFGTSSIEDFLPVYLEELDWRF